MIAEILDAITPLRPGSLPDNAALNMTGGPSGSHGAANNVNMAQYRWDAWKQALQRLESARAVPAFNAGGWRLKGRWSTFDDADTSLPPARPDVSDLLARGEVSMLVSAPGVGKSTLTALMAQAIAWGEHDLIGLSKLDWLGDVVIVSNEDGAGSLDRKLKAIKRKHGLGNGGPRPPHRIHLITQRPLTLIEQVNGTIMPTEAGIAFIDDLTAIRQDRDVCLVAIDTLSSIMLGLDENSAAAMQATANLLNSIVRRGFLSLLVLHHTNKGASGDAPDAMSFRGSSALSGAFRMMALLRGVTSKEGDAFGWKDESERKLRIVLDGPAGKANDRPKAGLHFFRFYNQPMLSVDPRNPGTPVLVPTGVLVHEKPVPSAPSATPEQVFEHLRARLAAGERVRHDTGRGGKTPPAGSDTLSLMAAFEMSAVEARTLVAALLNAKRMKLETARDRKANRDVQWLVLALPPGADEI